MVFKARLMRVLKLGVTLGVASALFWGCSHGRKKEYRLYRYDADRGMFIRDLENKDVLSHEQGHGLLCLKEEDVRNLFEPKEEVEVQPFALKP